MQDIAAAERYAQALFELACAMHQDHEIEEALFSFSQGLEKTPQAEKLLLSPNISRQQKVNMIERIFGQRQDPVQVVLLNFFSILLTKNRFNLIHEIAKQFKHIHEVSRKEGLLEITTACELAPSAEAQIVQKTQKMAGYTLKVQKRIDPAIIGGVILKMNNRIFDGSVLGQIRNCRETLKTARII